MLHCFVSIPVVGIRCAPSLNPFNPQSLISHLTNSNGCGNMSFKVPLMCPRVLPPSTLQETCFPIPLLAGRSNFCASGANSCSSITCALLNSLAALFRARTLCFQQFADSFAKMPGWGWHPDPVFGLSAGVDEDSRCWRRNHGTPQGGVCQNIVPGLFTTQSNIGTDVAYRGRCL